MPTTSVTILFAVVTAIALVDYAASTDMADSNDASKLALADIPPASPSSVAIQHGEKRSFRNGVTASTETAEERGPPLPRISPPVSPKLNAIKSVSMKSSSQHSAPKMGSLTLESILESTKHTNQDLTLGSSSHSSRLNTPASAQAPKLDDLGLDLNVPASVQAPKPDDLDLDLNVPASAQTPNPDDLDLDLNVPASAPDVAGRSDASPSVSVQILPADIDVMIDGHVMSDFDPYKIYLSAMEAGKNTEKAIIKKLLDLIEKYRVTAMENVEKSFNGDRTEYARIKNYRQDFIHSVTSGWDQKRFTPQKVGKKLGLNQQNLRTHWGSEFFKHFVLKRQGTTPEEFDRFQHQIEKWLKKSPNKEYKLLDPKEPGIAEHEKTRREFYRHQYELAQNKKRSSEAASTPSK